MSVRIEWEGADGSRWQLSDGPVRLSTGGVEGLGMPEFEFQTTTRTRSDGQRTDGVRVKPRTVFLPLNFKDEAATDLDLQAAWWRSLSEEEEGRLLVTAPTGEVRELWARLSSDSAMAYRLDPTVQTDTFGVVLIADRPLWRGPAERFEFSIGGDQVDFFGDGAAPPFTISPSSGMATRMVDNRGEYPAWARWTLRGPFGGFSVGFNGRRVSGTFSAGPGSVLVIDSDPSRQVATLDGVAVTRQLSEVDFAPVPARASSLAEIEIVGAGVVSLDLIPRYRRAF